MKTKMKINELSDLSNYIIAKSDELDSIYKDINTIIESVSNIWVGNDSKEFVEVATQDVKTEKEKDKKIRKFGENLATVAKAYKEQETNWAENIKRESLDHE